MTPPKHNATITLPAGTTFKVLELTVSLSDDFKSPAWFTEAADFKSSCTVAIGPAANVIIFDAMTAAGFKLNMITGEYERTYASKIKPA